MARSRLGAVVGLLVLGGCVHTPDGVRKRTGLARFDANSVTSPTNSYTREADGTWAGLKGDRYIVEDDSIRAVAAFATSGFIVSGSTRVNIDRAADGVAFIPTAAHANWIFVTEDGRAIPRDLEVPMYFAARLGMGGTRITFPDPDYREEWWHLGPDCSVTVFDLQGRRVAAWAQRRGGVACPQVHFPDPKILAFLEKGRNEHWESPLRAAK